MLARLSFLNPYWLWGVLSLPALGLGAALFGDDPRALAQTIHATGEFSARFMIISLMATPLMLLTKGSRFARWLRNNRRYFGVAAFGYAALHTAAYLMAETLARAWAEATDFEILTGWLAFAVFIPLALTSTDYAVRRMGRWWKPLQRWTYAAAVLTLLHWAALHDWGGWLPAAVHFAPLAALTAYRLWWTYLRKRPAAGPLAA